MTRLLSSAAVLIVSAGAASAGGFAVKEGSVSSQGTSFASYSAGANDITHIYQNPAALQKATGDGLTVGGSISVIIPDADGEFDTTPTGAFLGLSGGSGNPSKDALVPATYIGFRVDPRWAMGVSVTSPFGLRTEYDEGDPSVANFGATETNLRLITVTPMLAGEVFPGLTVGGGVSIAYADLTFNSANSTYKGDDFAFGYVLGAMADLTDSTRVGVAFRSGFKLEAEGDQTSVLAPGVTFQNTTFEADAPAVASVGLKQGLTDRLDLLLEAQWQNWSVLDEATISGPGGTVTETFGYQDAWFLAAGVEFAATEALVLRTGVAWDQSPTTDEDRSIRIPDEDRIWLSLGASYQLTEGLKIDAAYSYLRAIDNPKVEEITTTGNPAVVGSAEFEADVHIISVGASMDF